MEEMEQNQVEQQEPSMQHTSNTGAIIGAVGSAAITIGMFNNAYRFGRMGHIIKGSKNTEMVKALVDGEKIAGNFKIPMTDFITRGGIGEKINTFLKGSPEISGGFGYRKVSEGGMFGIKEGQGLGFNVSFNKQVLKDIESGNIDKELLKKNFAARHTVTDAEGNFVKVKSRNISKKEFNDLLNESMSAKGKYLHETAGITSVRKTSTDKIANDIYKEMLKVDESFAKKERTIKATIKSSLFEKKEGAKIFKATINEESMSKAFQALEKKGIKIAEQDAARIAEKAIVKKAAKFAGKKVAKYAALTPLAALGGPVGAGIALVAGTAFAAYDIITSVKLVSDLNNEIFEAKKNKQNTISSKNYNENIEKISNQKSAYAATNGFRTLQQANFGLGNMMRTKNMASDFLNEASWS